MRDLIERKLAIDIFDDLQTAHEEGIEGAYEYYRKEMCGLPSIQSESTRGYWIILGGNDRKCSACKYVFHKLTEEQNFCPNCGCDMRAIDTKGGQDRIDDDKESNDATDINVGKMDDDKLDEAIRDFERNAQNDEDNFHLTGAKCFNGCAEYEWRIVSWLRELKERRQQGGK